MSAWVSLPAAAATRARRHSAERSSARSGSRRVPIAMRRTTRRRSALPTPLPRRHGCRHPSRARPLLVGGNLLPHDPEEAVRAVVAKELEPLSKILDRRLEIVVRAEIALEPVVL